MADTENRMPAPALEELARMETIFGRQRQAYAREPFPSLAERRRHLSTLRRLLIEHQDPIAEAAGADFSARALDETLFADVMPCIQNVDYTLKRLPRWMKPSPRHVALHLQPARARVFYQPLGVVGIMVPFNYPVNLALAPLIGALAAGNRVMIKMSELTPRTAERMAEMLAEGFEEDRVAVVTGEADVAAAFSKLPFDHLLFTGSIPVGKLVMRAAADNLTPVTLELGGKSPTLIADDIPLGDIIDRICFAKSVNAGQTCVAPDYVLVPRGKVATFIELYRTTFRRMYPVIKGNPDYTSIINARSRRRLQSWLQDAADKGARIEKTSDEVIDDGTFRMPPHLVTGVTEEMKLMQEEIFGPILPVIPYDHIDEALEFVKRRPRPLAFYLFTYDRALQDRVVAETHAGSMCINDALIQVGVDDLPFGGIGPSGMGHYHGHEGFLAFSKAKSVLTKGRLNSLKLIYPPYGRRVQRWLQRWLTR